jgi:hypothetical protein
VIEKMGASSAARLRRRGTWWHRDGAELEDGGELWSCEGCSMDDAGR